MRAPNDTPKTWDNRLFLSILALLVIPSLYRSYSVYLIGNTPPDEQNLAIVAQWQFVQVAIEVLQEALVFPLFYLIGSLTGTDRDQIFRQVRASTAMLLIILVPILLALLAGMPFFVESIHTENPLRSLTVQFLRIRTGGLALSLLSAGLVIMIEALRKSNWIWQLTILKLVLSMALDSLFFGGFGFSLSWGVIGLAWSQLLVELGVLGFVLWRLYGYFDRPLADYWRFPQRLDWLPFSRIGGWVALESLVRNLAYWLLILRLINTLGAKPISAYFLAMHLFWSFALVPVNALVETMRVLIANAANSLTTIKSVLWAGCRRGGLVLLCWLPGLLFLEPVLAFFTDDPDLLVLGRQVINYLFPAYLLLAMTLLLNALFIGLGQTRYLAYQSMLTNLIVYGPAYLAYQLQWWAPTLTSILLLFGIGIIVGNLLTVYFAWRILRP